MARLQGLFIVLLVLGTKGQGACSDSDEGKITICSGDSSVAHDCGCELMCWWLVETGVVAMNAMC